MKGTRPEMALKRRAAEKTVLDAGLRNSLLPSSVLSGRSLCSLC
jgi:hypothetical protein